MRIVEVGWLVRYIKDLLAEDYTLQDVWVQGEISGYKQAASGHRYFTLKDGYAAIRCVLFAGYRVPPLREGMAAFIHGRMDLWEQRGDIQFYVDDVRDAGEGLLSLRFEALKARLEAEGLFAPERKRPLPERVRAVGVVTSLQAAALSDILRTLRLRCPLVEVIVAPTLVQGDGAADQIAAAIDLLNAHGQADVIIVARGGGSIEELWAFNEEPVARAIARSRAPIVTGVGHETDYTIADFVADVRASTPTAAAIATVPDAAHWRSAIEAASIRLDDAIASHIIVLADSLAAPPPRLDPPPPPPPPNSTAPAPRAPSKRRASALTKPPKRSRSAPITCSPCAPPRCVPAHCDCMPSARCSPSRAATLSCGVKRMAPWSPVSRRSPQGMD